MQLEDCKTYFLYNKAFVNRSKTKPRIIQINHLIAMVVGEEIQ